MLSFPWWLVCDLDILFVVDAGHLTCFKAPDSHLALVDLTNCITVVVKVVLVTLRRGDV